VTERDDHADAAGFRCPICAAEMRYDAGARAMACAFCDGRVAIAPLAGAAVVEHALADGLARAERGYGVAVRRARCEACGATVSFGETTTATACDFCAAPSVLVEADLRQVLRPESLLPFEIDAARARAAFATWIGGLWFRPNDLARLASVSEAHGVYVPYWTFDCDVASSWTAESGTYYYETERYSVTVDGRSESRTRQVRKTRWRAASGRRADHHDDVLVCASKGVPSELAVRLDTFDASKLVPWRPEYLAGWKAEEYALELEPAWDVARARIAAEQERRCAGDVPGDTQRGLEVSNAYAGETFKHVLLPIWIAAYRYRGEVYRFLVNGQTGEVEGKAPWSVAKITAAVLAVVALALAIVVAWHRG
jgi:hypothetical protein